MKASQALEKVVADGQLWLQQMFWCNLSLSPRSQRTGAIFLRIFGYGCINQKW